MIENVHSIYGKDLWKGQSLYCTYTIQDSLEVYFAVPQIEERKES